MVMDEIASKKFNWPREIPVTIEGDPRLFMPDCDVSDEAKTTILSFRSKFADLPSAGIWENRTESDEELLVELGSGWRVFAAEQ